MISTGLPKTASPSYKHAEEGHSTVVVRDTTASQGAAAGDAGGTAGDDVGRGSRTNSLVGVVGILGRGFIGTDYSSVEFLKPAPAFLLTLYTVWRRRREVQGERQTELAHNYTDHSGTGHF